MKQIAIKIAGSERDLIDRTIKPGTTAGEILADIGLDGYILSAGPKSDRFFAEDENVYAQVSDGDKLWASTPADVGDSIGQTARAVELLRQSCLPLRFKFVKNLLTVKRRATVKRASGTFLREQGWRLINAWSDPQWVGYYRIGRFGSFKGKVESLSSPRFYIHNPPEVLRRHSHWACFTDHGGGWYRVHFRKMPKELDSGLMCILRILTEAFLRV